MNNITLTSIDTKYKNATLKVLKEQSKLFDFNKVVFFTNGVEDGSIIIENIPDIVGKKEGHSYSYFCLRELPKRIDTEFCLVVQHDGFIINPHLWSDEFLEYDYIGAPWPYNYFNKVGNGGFSLRSKKFLDVCDSIFENVNIDEHEDLLACVIYYDEMKKRGIKFAPPELAARFALEHWTEYHLLNGQTFPTFGFHGDSTQIGKNILNENNNSLSL